MDVVWCFNWIPYLHDEYKRGVCAISIPPPSHRLQYLQNLNGILCQFLNKLWIVNFERKSNRPNKGNVMDHPGKYVASKCDGVELVQIGQ